MVRLRRHAVRAVALPVRARGAVQGAVPGRLHLRGDRPDARLVLHAARARHAAPPCRSGAGGHRLPQRDLDRPHPRRRGAEDVEVAGQHRRPVGGAGRTRRGCAALVRLHLGAGRQRAPLPHRSGGGGVAALHVDALEHAFLLRHLRQPRRLRPRCAAVRRGTQGARPLGALGVAPHGAARHRGARCVRAVGGGAADRRVRGAALELVRAAQPPALLELGRFRRRACGDGHAVRMPDDADPAAGAVHAVPGGDDVPQPRRREGRGRAGVRASRHVAGGRRGGHRRTAVRRRGAPAADGLARPRCAVEGPDQGAAAAGDRRAGAAHRRRARGARAPGR